MSFLKNNIYHNSIIISIKVLAISAFMASLLTLSGITTAQEFNNRQSSPKTYEIDSVIIRARKETRNLMARPYTEPNSLLPSISILKNEEIRKQGALNVVEALKYIPGALIESRGRQVKQFFSVRGQKYPYPDYAINGVWQKEFVELPYFFSTSDIEEIEIIRSSAALLTGLSGMAGLINIKTREYTSSETNLELEYGSYNSLHTHLSNGNKIGQFSYSAGIGYNKNDGPAGKHAKEERSKKHLQTQMTQSGESTLFSLYQ